MENSFSIPVYIINLEGRTERKEHVLKEFVEHNEFNVNIVTACEDEIGAVGLWNTIRHILQDLVNKQDEYIIICEDDHLFTENYSKEYLFACIAEAKEKHAGILCGGVSWFEDAIQASNKLFWVRKFSGLQFTVIFKEIFAAMLETDFNKDDAADYKISELCADKFFVHPFISVQREFGYSDVTAKNNRDGRVEELFIKSMASAQILKDVSKFYTDNLGDCNENIDIEAIENINIPAYVISSLENIEQRLHIQNQFLTKREFDVTIVDACTHEIEAVGQWRSIRKIIELAIKNEDDVIIICEDSHQFTEDYSWKYLLKNILEAHQQGVEILSGGTDNFGISLPVTKNRFWIHSFTNMQFLILYRSVFQKILDEPFDNNIIATDAFSEITGNKMVLFPFISAQKQPMHSHLPKSDLKLNKISNCFKNAENRLELVQRIYDKYCNEKHELKLRVETLEKTYCEK